MMVLWRAFVTLYGLAGMVVVVFVTNAVIEDRFSPGPMVMYIILFYCLVGAAIPLLWVMNSIGEKKVK